MEMNRCIYCGHPGRVVNSGDVYYAQCSKCHKRDPYNYAAINRTKAIEQWNEENQEKMAPEPLKEEDLLFMRPTRVNYVYKINNKVYSTQLAVAHALNTVSSTISNYFRRSGGDTMIYNGVTVTRKIIPPKESPLQVLETVL